jgi:hypothetical protein
VFSIDYFRQAVCIGGSLHDDISAVAPVAPVRATPWNVFFPTKAQGPVAAIPASNMDLNTINKH